MSDNIYQHNPEPVEEIPEPVDHNSDYVDYCGVELRNQMFNGDDLPCGSSLPLPSNEWIVSVSDQKNTSTSSRKTKRNKKPKTKRNKKPKTNESNERIKGVVSNALTLNECLRETVSVITHNTTKMFKKMENRNLNMERMNKENHQDAINIANNFNKLIEIIKILEKSIQTSHQNIMVDSFFK